MPNSPGLLSRRVTNCLAASLEPASAPQTGTLEAKKYLKKHVANLASYFFTYCIRAYNICQLMLVRCYSCKVQTAQQLVFKDFSVN
jgi:hypothetical protein